MSSRKARPFSSKFIVKEGYGFSRQFSGVAADLRGYGDSSKPDGGDKYVNYSKRAMALDMAEVMRAGASIDLEHDEADRAKKIACPMMALWAERGNTGRTFDVKATWQARAAMPVSGKALPGGHFLPEETSEQTLAELRAFLSA